MVAVTRELARCTVESRFEDLPDSFMKLRNVGKMNILNDAAHSRSLFESIMHARVPGDKPLGSRTVIAASRTDYSAVKSGIRSSA